MHQFLLRALASSLAATLPVALSGCGAVTQSALPERFTASQSSAQTMQNSVPVAQSSSFVDVLAGANSSSGLKQKQSLSAPSYHGCQVFAPGGYYNADISGSPIDAHSSSYLSSLSATDNTGFYASTGAQPINIASTSTSLYRVRPKVSWHTFPDAYPWSSSFKIEPAGDAHAVVILAKSPACHLYEAYSTSFSSNILSAYSGANWDLSQPYQIASSSSMASGLSLFAGSVRHEEIATGIRHAINFTVFSHSPCDCFTAPASGTDGLSYEGPPTSFQMPYGAHLRLKSSFSESGYGPQTKAILEAMKHYGMYLADTGGHYTNNNALYLVNPNDGGNWDGTDLRGLGNLRFADFEVLTVGKTTSR